MKTIAENLAKLSACKEGIEWSKPFGIKKQAAWTACNRGDWMVWIICKQITSPPWSDGRKPLLACCLDIAETVKVNWPESHREQMVDAIGTLRAWIDGKATVDDAQAAKDVLRSAAQLAAQLAESSAVRSAESAVSAASAARSAASAASAVSAESAARSAARSAASAESAELAAWSAVWSAESAVRSAARSASLSAIADIVRKHFPKPPTIKVKA